MLHLGGSYPLEVVDVADVAGETNKYMDIVDTVDTCRVPTGLSERSIAWLQVPLKVVDITIAVGETDPCRDVLIGGGWYDIGAQYSIVVVAHSAGVPRCMACDK